MLWTRSAHMNPGAAANVGRSLNPAALESSGGERDPERRARVGAFRQPSDVRSYPSGSLLSYNPLSQSPGYCEIPTAHSVTIKWLS